MAFSINSILGHPMQNAYVSEATADDYFASRIETLDWDAASSGEKQTALVEASRLIDTLPLAGRRMFRTKRQGLRLPNSKHTHITGSVNSASDDTSFVDTSLALTDYYYDDQFIGGSIVITAGTGKGSHVTISDFDVSTGTVTVASAFSATLDDTSTYTLVYPLPEPFVSAVCEQAQAVLSRSMYTHANKIASGVLSEKAGEYSVTYGRSDDAIPQPSLVSPVALSLLKPYLSWNVVLEVNE